MKKVITASSYNPLGSVIKKLMKADNNFMLSDITDAKVVTLGDGSPFLICYDSAEGVIGMDLNPQPDYHGEDEVFDRVYNSYNV